MAMTQCAENLSQRSPSTGLMAPEQIQDSPPHPPCLSHPDSTQRHSRPDQAKIGSGSGWTEHHQAELERWKLTTSPCKHTQKNAMAQVLGR